MIKKTALITLISACSSLQAATHVHLYREPINHLDQLLSSSSLSTPKKNSVVIKQNSSELKRLNQTQANSVNLIRYQQLYKGIPIVGAQVIVSRPHSLRATANDEANGYIFNDVELDTNPAITSQQAIELAKKAYFDEKGSQLTHRDTSELQIRADENNELNLVYLVSFKSELDNHKPVWPYFVIDAQTGAIVKQWNNHQTHTESGPGGNEKVHEYWYGKDELPGLEITKNNNMCVMEDEQVRLVNVNSEWDWKDLHRKAFSYPCDNKADDYVNGAFSPSNDAYYFGHTIVSLFKDWYGLNVLQDQEGNFQKLIMRVHFGQGYDNAFWDGETMTFGDGYYFYPLVSLDVAGHEVAHGFTQQHANLEYHDESGALNESFSDMAGQASRAYLLEKQPNLYNKAHLTPNVVTWGIGETIVRPPLPMKALRFMDMPSKDGMSADCVDKKLARQNQSVCAISYPELVAYAKSHYSDEDERQSFIVHTASGVFNRAFYLMSKQLGIKKSFHLMTLANAKYWTTNTNFLEGACGVIYASKDLNIDMGVPQFAFRRVGIDVTKCK